MSKSQEIKLHVMNVEAVIATIVLLAILTLSGCVTKERVDYVYLSPDCVVPALVEPGGFNWDDLSDVPVSTKVDIDETMQELIDEILVRHAMLVEICEGIKTPKETQ